RQGAGDSAPPGGRACPVRPGRRVHALLVDGRYAPLAGAGEMPTGPVVEYLARSLSAFYAVMGALCLVLATDLERYRPLVGFLGVAFALMSLVLLGVDLAAGMPWWWSASEGPGGVVFGALLFVLARPADSKDGTA